MRKKTRQELRTESPDRPIKSAKKKVHKPFVVQYRYIGPINLPIFEMLRDWRGDRKFAKIELAEAYVAKQQRVRHLSHYEFRIVSKDT